MSASPIFCQRSTSPDYYVPISRSELLGVYRSWNSVSPRIQNKTYKKDAASLVVS